MSSRSRAVTHRSDNGYGRRIQPAGNARFTEVEFVNQIADFTWTSSNSSHFGCNVPSKTCVFMPAVGFRLYVDKCKVIVASRLSGFVLEK
jgi:hypothetical protein